MIFWNSFFQFKLFFFFYFDNLNILNYLKSRNDDANLTISNEGHSGARTLLNDSLFDESTIAHLKHVDVGWLALLLMEAHFNLF